MSSYRFAREFIRSPLSTGAVSAASVPLVDAMLESIDFHTASSVVELGPGNGAVTELLLERLRPSTHFVAMELNQTFAEQARRRFPQARIVINDAANIQLQLTADGLQNCDYVVSGLPWMLFDTDKQNELLNAIAKALVGNGKFIMYTYAGLKLLPRGQQLQDNLIRHFASVDASQVVWRNLPPAVVYTCAAAPLISTVGFRTGALHGGNRRSNIENPASVPDAVVTRE